MVEGVASERLAFQDSPTRTEQVMLLAGAECCYLVCMPLLDSACAHLARLRHTTPLLAACVALGALVGCGGSTPGPEEGSPSETSGSESAVDSGSETDGSTTLAETLELPTTTLIPVPSSGVPRHQMSATLRDIWRRVEEASAMTPPDYTGELTSDAITPWLTNELMPWAQERGAASAAAAEAAAPLPAGSPEYGVAAALVGYTYEEFVIAFRGAPVPAELAADAELLQIYLDALTSASEPMARQAAGGYGACARTLAPLGPDSPWVEWAQYCLYRATEVNEVYRLEE